MTARMMAQMLGTLFVPNRWWFYKNDNSKESEMNISIESYLLHITNIYTHKTYCKTPTNDDAPYYFSRWIHIFCGVYSFIISPPHTQPLVRWCTTKLLLDYRTVSRQGFETTVFYDSIEHCLAFGVVVWLMYFKWRPRLFLCSHKSPEGRRKWANQISKDTLYYSLRYTIPSNVRYITHGSR